MPAFWDPGTLGKKKNQLLAELCQDYMTTKGLRHPEKKEGLGSCLSLFIPSPPRRSPPVIPCIEPNTQITTEGALRGVINRP